MNTPLFSIIIPVKDRVSFIEDCLNSVLNQSYKNFEIILVDDNSEENIKNRFRELSELDNRIMFYENIDQEGVSAARNEGSSLAKGEYVMFLDDDDQLEEGYLKEAKEASQPFHITVMNAEIHPSSDKSLFRTYNQASTLASLHAYSGILNLYQLLLTPPPINALVIPKGLLQPFPTSLKAAEDMTLWATLLQEGVIFNKVSSNAKAQVRVHRNSIQSEGIKVETFFFLESLQKKSLDTKSYCLLHIRIAVRSLLQVNIGEGIHQSFRAMHYPLSYLEVTRQLGRLKAIAILKFALKAKS